MNILKLKNRPDGLQLGFLILSLGLCSCDFWNNDRADFTQSVDTNIEGIRPEIKDLYLELQQTYSRSFEKNGYALQFSIQKPNTIIIKLEYVPGSAEQPLAFKVLDGAKFFVGDIALKKYKIHDLQIKTEPTALQKNQIQAQ